MRSEEITSLGNLLNLEESLLDVRVRVINPFFGVGSMGISYFRQHLTKPWEQKILDWCVFNGIEDVRPYRAGNEWTLGWPPYVPGTTERVLKVIHLSVPGEDLGPDSFEAYSGAFTNHAYPPLKVKWSDKHAFSESDLEKSLGELKQYADGLREDDLVLFGKNEA